MAVPQMIVGDVAQVVLYQRLHQQACLNVLYYQLVTRPASAPYFEQIEDLLNSISGPGAGSIVSLMKVVQSENLTHVWCQGQAVYPVRRPYFRVGLGETGGVLTPCAATNVSAVLTKQVERPGRGRVGSFHLAGLPAASYEFGELKAPVVVSLNELGGALSQLVKTSALEYEWKPVTFNSAGNPPEHVNEILNVFPQTTLRVMRRRTVGLGI